VNWLGAESAGKFALFIALVALGVSATMALVAIPAFARGVETISFDYFRNNPPQDAWVNFTKICLALAGVEAVANMTGMMKKPVDKEAKKTIWPVSIEVVGLNLLFGLALAGLTFTVAGTQLQNLHTPDDQRLVETREQFVQSLAPDVHEQYDTSRPIILSEEEVESLPPAAKRAYEDLATHRGQVNRYTNAAMRVIARNTASDLFGERIGNIFANIAGITFGLLLLSATNTAIMAMVSVFYAMAQDKELPHSLTRLNYSGVPYIGLIISIIIPAAVILVEQDVTVLASLYVLGVTGAITVTVLSSAINTKLELSLPVRIAMWALGLFLLSITVTIGITQPVSTAFSGTLVAMALGIRTIRSLKPASTGKAVEAPGAGWMSILSEKVEIDTDKPKIMLAARGRYQSEYAIDLAKRRDATLMAIFVRQIRIMDMGPDRAPRIETDTAAQETLGTTAMLAKEAGVPFIPIYVTATSIPEEILDYTVTYNCDTLIMGKSRRSNVARRLEGDVISQVAKDLPEGIILMTRAADVPHAMMPPGMGTGATK
jgi:nucleotide-binding universal stress UspA family protein/amino acid transporter